LGSLGGGYADGGRGGRVGGVGWGGGVVEYAKGGAT